MRRMAWIVTAAVAALGLLAACGGEIESEDWEEAAYREPTAASGCGPQIESGKVAALFVYQDCDGTWRVRATAGGGSATYAGVLTSDKPVKVTAYHLEKHDLLDASNPKKVRFEHNMYQSFLDGFDIVLPAGAKAVLTLQQGGPLLAGKEAKKVSSPLVLEANAGSPPGTTTPPTSAGKVKTKWYPGHYSKTQASWGPGYIGFRVNTSWRMLEPQEGSYNFSAIETALNQAESQGKKVMLFFQVLDYGSSTTGSAPQWAANKGASYAGHFGDGRQFGVVKVWEEWVSDYFIKLWDALRKRFDSHPALAMVAIGESLMSPAPAPGHTPEKMRDQWLRWCDHFATWVQTPKVFTMTFGATKYAKQMSQYAVNHRVGIRDPDQTTHPEKCGIHPQGLSWIHAWQDYRGQAIYQEMVSFQSSQCLPSVQAAFDHAVKNGIHYLDWVNAPKNWSRETQQAFIQSKANLPAGGLLADRPSQWPEYIEITK